MVVLSCSITTKSGRPVMSRQFNEITRMRIEGLLAAFPKLIGAGKSRQHQYVDTDSVRYVYQPLESLFILLITNKASNIVEDLETLRLLSKVVPDIAGGATEEKIAESVFELIFAFDEVLSSGGYKEGLPLSTIKSNLEMESHEEKLHMMIQQSKQDAAKDEMKRQAKLIKERQLQVMKSQLGGGAMPAASGMAGFGGGGSQAASGPSDPFSMMGMSSDPSSSNDAYSSSASTPYENSFDRTTAAEAAPSAPRVVAKGMKLGGMKISKKNDMMAAMAAEDGISAPPPAASSALASLSAPAAPPAPPSTPVSLSVEEKVNVTMSREGEVLSCEIKGTLSLTANTEEGACVVLSVDKNQITSNDLLFTMNTHPKIDKNAWESNGQLGTKGGKGIPLGRPVGILRWSHSSTESCPITVNCWVEPDGAGQNLNLEYELRDGCNLSEVKIVIPGVFSTPKVISVDGQYKHDGSTGCLIWYNQLVDSSNSSGALEFTVDGSSAEFFPISVGYNSKPMCPVVIQACAGGSGPVQYELSERSVPESYTCS